MADISVKGFVSKATVRDGKNGKFVTYTISEGVKNKEGKYENFFYNVVDFKSGGKAPENGARVTVKGWLKLRKHEDKIVLDVQAEECETISPPKPRKDDSPAPGGEDFPF